MPITSLDMLRQLTTVTDLTTCKGVTIAENSSFYSLQMKPMAKTLELNSSIRWQVFWMFTFLYLWIFIAFIIGPPIIIRKPCVESVLRKSLPSITSSDILNLIGYFAFAPEDSADSEKMFAYECGCVARVPKF